MAKQTTKAMAGRRAAPATIARGLLARARWALLASALAGGEGHPFGSLVLVASSADGAPILLLSTLAQHSQNLARDPRASLTIADFSAGSAKAPGDLLAGPRITLLGRLLPTALAADRRRFLRAHPSAKRYAAFGDFAFYRFEIARAHLIEGFGRILWLDGDALYPPARLKPRAKAGSLTRKG